MKYINDNIIIGIPVYNEKKYANEVIDEVLKYARNIVIVNDGSDDGTDILINNYDKINIINHPQNMGYGASLKSIFKFAISHNFKWVITMDCDHQHQPSYLLNFAEMIRLNETDIISGSRYLDPDLVKSVIPKERFEINQTITKIINKKLKINITDSFCGFKAYRVNKLKKLNLCENGYAFPLELWAIAAYEKFRIVEIPVPLIYYDSKRNFAGKLENYNYRLNYYLKTINKVFSSRLSHHQSKVK